MERDVLSAAGARIRSLSKSFAKTTNLTEVMRLVAATEEWYVEANDRNVKLHAVLTEASANAAGLWDNAKSDWHARRIEQAARDYATTLPSAYRLAVATR